MNKFSKLKNICLVFFIAGLDLLGGPLLLYCFRQHGAALFPANQFTAHPAEVLRQIFMLSLCFFLIFAAFWRKLKKNFWKEMGLKIQNSFQRDCAAILILLLILAGALGIRRSEDPVQVIFSLLYYVFAIGFTEEFLFRGACDWLLKCFPWQVRYLLPSFLFGMIHIVAYGGFEPVTWRLVLEFMTAQLPGLMGSGCCLQLVRDRTGTLWVPVLLHGLMDFSILFL